MARKTAPATGLGGLLGGMPGPGAHSMGSATKRLPWWAKLAMTAAAVLLAWAITDTTPQLLVLVLFGGFGGLCHLGRSGVK